MNRTTGIAVLLLLALTARAEPPMLIKVTIPDYTIVKAGEYDRVVLPGGLAWLEDEGCPEVPYLFKPVEYPDGYRVQDVTLKSRTGEEIRTGLNLPVVIMDSAQKAAVPIKPGVYPTRDFAWQAHRNLDGSTQLGIVIFPFFYDRAKTELKAWKNHEFEVRYVRTTVSLADVDIDQKVYGSGETVRARIKLNNTGKPQPLVLSAQIRRSFTEDRVADVPERRIEALGRSDSLTLEWPTGTAQSGDYQLMVMVRDPDGNELDQGRVEFRIGLPACEVTAFSARPEQFKLNDQVKLSLEARNNGAFELSGQVVFEIRTRDSLVQSLEQDFGRFAPGQTRMFTAVWNTKSAVKGQSYDVLGYVRYAGTACLPLRARVSTNALPRAVFVVAPETVGVDQPLKLDASGSSDPDGQVTEYTWEISDGATLSGVAVEHAFSWPGSYEILLTVRDNEGAEARAERTITVTE